MVSWENSQLGTILIVDDSRTNLSFLSSILENAGYAVITAGNGASALSAASSQHPSLILLDVDMPDIDGFDVCRLLKEENATRNIPVIFISAMDDVSDKIRGFESGGVDYITKPFQLEEVMARVKTHLTLYHLQKEIEAAGHRDWQATFNTVNEAIFLTDAQGHIIDCNRAALSMLRRSPEDPPRGFIGQLLFNDPFKVGDIFSLHGEIQFPRFEGWYEISTYPLSQAGERSGTVFVIENITEKKQIEGLMISSQRMADLGALSAAITHELKSPLQVITWASESLMERLKRGPLQEENASPSLEAIHTSSWRINDIILSLLNYARSSSGENEPQDFNAIIEDTLRLIEHQLNVWANIRLSIQLGSDLLPLACDRLKVSQVLINLLMNARDAMPSGGTIRISTAYNPSSDALELCIADTGAGIPEEIRSKIFEQFFTTKPVGQGTGLGLYIVSSVMKAHGGSIQLQSRVGEGTTFNLLFPLHPSEQIPERSAASE
jgi:two-component system, cell cycle sensor histidine kinase and response regulator CckA